MPYTIAYSFDKFLSNIEVTGYSKDIAKGREDKIKSLLESKFEILDAFAIGSLPKFTAVKKHADLDIFIVLHYSKHIADRKPSNVLLSIKNALNGYTSSVRRNGQAVSLTFSNWPSVDIVPVSRTTNSEGAVSYYNVPNTTNETWIKSRPRLHASRMTDRNSDRECGEKFKRMVKMVKWWNYENGAYLSSYHIEIIALDTFHSSIDEYPFEIYWFFKAISEKAHNTISDGLNSISSELTFAQREIFDLRISNAVRRLNEAYIFTLSGKDKDAIDKYRVVFGDEFPAYG